MAEARYWTGRFEKVEHACPDCGFVGKRQVLVENGQYTPRPCSICKKERAARHHFNQGRRMMRDVAEMRARRRAHQAKRAKAAADG